MRFELEAFALHTEHDATLDQAAMLVAWRYKLTPKRRRNISTPSADCACRTETAHMQTPQETLLSLARSAFQRARLKKTRWPTSAKEEKCEGVIFYLAARAKRGKLETGIPASADTAKLWPHIPAR